MTRLLLWLIAWYKRWLSPLQRVPHCRFLPTCSDYAAEAIQLHGSLRGSFMALGRVVRCQPLCKGGHDPVKLPEGTTR